MSLTLFLALHLTPGNPAQLLLRTFATPEALSRLTLELELDQPLPVQYGHWLARDFQGDLGTSIHAQSSGHGHPD